MEIIDFILYFFASIVMSQSLIKGFSIITKNVIKLNLIKHIGIILICILIVINNYYNLSTIRILISFLLTFELEYIVFDENIKDTTINVMILTICSILIEILITPLFAFTINIKIFNNNSIFKIIFSVINSIFLLIVLKFKKILILIDKLKELINNVYNFYTLSIIVIFILNLMIYFRGENLQDASIIIVILISLLMFVICLKVIINDKYNNKILLEKNQNLRDSYKAYAKTIDDCREMKHNLNSDLYSLKSIIPKEHHEVINELYKKYNSKYEWITKIGNIPEGLQGIIYLKSLEAKKQKINIHLNAEKEIKYKDKDYLNLCNIIEILVDNAIYSTKLANKKVIEINIANHNKKLKIQIINSFINKIDLNKIGNKNYSTKEFKSGLGLNYIKNIKRNRINIKYKIINDLFIAEIIYK